MISTMSKEVFPFVFKICIRFPGIVDGLTKVDGDELVKFMRDHLCDFPEIRMYMKGYLVGKESTAE